MGDVVGRLAKGMVLIIDRESGELRRRLRVSRPLESGYHDHVDKALDRA